MAKLHDQSTENVASEGGVFYPKGYIVAGFDTPEHAEQAIKALAGHALTDVTPVSPSNMARQAAENLENPGILSGMGSTVAVREKQKELAEEGCSFLLIKAEEDEHEEAAIKALSAGPIRYAAKYRMLVIENLLPKIPSASVDAEPARDVGSKR